MMARKGLGKGLDSLIPDFYNEDFDSNSPQSLEDLLKESESEVENVEGSVENTDSTDEKENIFEKIEEEDDQEKNSNSDAERNNKESNPEEEEIQVDDGESENLSGDKDSEGSLQTSQEIQIQKEHVAEVKEIVDKNPRITLWSSRSSAVFRYLRKTEPEFSISKEASLLIEEAVAKKYPEIWALFDDY
jgi:hypothetical protein